MESFWYSVWETMWITFEWSGSSKQKEGLLERREDRTIRKAVEVLEGLCDDF